jgi:hypothetical protein
MKYLGTSGITGHGISTVAGIIVVAATAAGYLSQEQSTAITAALPGILSSISLAVTGIMGILALFYKGHPVEPCSPPTNFSDSSADKVG